MIWIRPPEPAIRPFTCYFTGSPDRKNRRYRFERAKEVGDASADPALTGLVARCVWLLGPKIRFTAQIKLFAPSFSAHVRIPTDPSSLPPPKRIGTIAAFPIIWVILAITGPAD
jgi:hypothetical protein